MFEYTYKNLFIKSISIGGTESCYIFPNFGIAFDAGRAPFPLLDIPTLFLTHGHLDHAAGVPYYISQRSLRNQKNTTIYLPPKLKRPLSKIMKCWNKIEDYKTPVDIQALKTNGRVEIQKNYFVQALPTFHRIPSNGYVILHKTQKLKEEYISLPAQKIATLRQEKKDIFYTTENPIFALSGDSTIEFVLNNPLAQTASVLFMECTYIDDKRPVERARQWGHTHLDEIIHYADVFKNEKIVLIHFSLRYSPNYIRKILEKKLPSSLKDRVEILYRKNEP